MNVSRSGHRVRAEVPRRTATHTEGAGHVVCLTGVVQTIWWLYLGTIPCDRIRALEEI
jgi:hypothetical protein